MKPHRIRPAMFAALPAVLLGACVDELFTTTVSFGDDASATIELEMDISGECSGSGTREDEHGVTRWTKTALGDGEAGTCRIDVTWEGDLISLAGMRRDTIAECGADHDHCDPDELDLSLSIRIESAVFDAGPARMSREQLLALTARATTGPATLFELDRTTPLPLELGADPAVEAQLRAAYLVAGSLPVTASGSLELSMADVRRLQEGSSTGVLTISLASKLAGSIEAHL